MKPRRPSSPRSHVPPGRRQPLRKGPWRAICFFLALACLVAVCLVWRQYARPGLVQSRAGAEALAAQRPADAEREWRQGTKEDPASPDCFVQLGDLYLSQKRYTEAAAQYLTASRLSPKDGDLFLKLTRANLAAGGERAAESSAKRAAELRPDDADAWGLYGLIEQHLLNQPAAVAALRRAHDLRPSDRDYLIELVRTEANHLNLPQAERDLAPFLQAHPDDPMACHLMAFILQQKPRAPEILRSALGYELKAQAGMPGDLRVYISLGDLYRDMDRLPDALRNYQEGLKLNPRSEEMLHGLVTCYNRLGQARQAASVAARLQALTALHQRITHLKDVLKGTPSDIDAGLQLGRLQEQDADDAGAHATYALLVRQAPTDPRPRRALAAFYLRLGRPDLARQALDPAYIP